MLEMRAGTRTCVLSDFHQIRQIWQSLRTSNYIKVRLAVLRTNKIITAVRRQVKTIRVR